MRGCGKELGYKDSETGKQRLCGEEVFAGMETGLVTVFCNECKYNALVSKTESEVKKC